MNMVQAKNSVLGITALVMGCCIGAGMLGLPLVTMSSGFVLSIIPLLIGWIYMYLSGLMLVEIYVDVKKDTNLMGLLNEILGKRAKIIGAGLFFFLFYSILTAYLNVSTILIQLAFNKIFKTNIAQSFYLLFNALILFVIILCNVRKIDLINRFFILCMLFFYIGLVYLGFSQINIASLRPLKPSPNISTIVWAIPIFILSFGFQNLIPTISHYLQCNIKKIKLAIFQGTFATFLIYLLWNFVVLMVVSNKEQEMVGTGSKAIHTLFNSSSPKLNLFIEGFSFCAIVTSILAVALSLLNFISNSSKTQKNNISYAALTIIPPAIFSFLNPDIFLTMLHLAGGIGAVCLFGIYPPMMLWKKRYILKIRNAKAFPFEKPAIIFYVLISIIIVVLEIINLTYKPI